MSWWNRSGLRVKIFVSFSALIVAVLLATLGFTQRVITREAEARLGRELQTTGQVFESLMKERAAQLQSNSTLLASDFALKRVLATHFDPKIYDAGTLASAGMSYRERIGVELVWMTDETGLLLAASPGNPRVGRSVLDVGPLREALTSEEAASAVVEVDGKLFQMVAVPVFAPDAIGFLLLGKAIDDAVAAQLRADTGSEITFLTSQQVFASSWAPAQRHDLVSPDMQAMTDRIPRGPYLVDRGRERYLSIALPVAADIAQPLHALVQGSYDKALVPLRTLQWRILIVGVMALAGALIVGVLLATGIIRPVRTLVAAMRAVLGGNLQQHAQVDRGDEIGFLARSFNEMIDGLRDRERIKDTFGRFVSRDVATAVLDGRVPLGGERVEVTILFQDIRGFTALSHKLDPATLLRVLNQLFTAIVAAVEAEGGMVKQFTGDGVMALFGVPQRRADHAERAVRAALGIVRGLARVNESLRGQNVPELRIGVGLHTGEVVAGLIGPDERVEYGVVGEPVNLASRIEALTKEVATTILVSKDIASRLGPDIALGRATTLPVRGLAQPIEVVEVMAPT